MEGRPTCASAADGSESCFCFRWNVPAKKPTNEAAVFKLVYKDFQKISLYYQAHNCQNHQDQLKLHTALYSSIQKECQRTLKPETALAWIKQHKLHKSSLADFFTRINRDAFPPASAPKPFRINAKADVINTSKGSQNNTLTGDLKNLCMGQGGLSSEAVAFWSSIKIISIIYEQSPGATFPIKIFDSPFPLFDYDRGWKSFDRSALTRSLTFSCIATLESGGVWIGPDHFSRAFALSVGNSLYVSKFLLEDPQNATPDAAVKRIIGNLGRPGISILVSPEDLSVKKTTNFHMVNHVPYDGKRLNSFKDISLHLALTEWRLPLSDGSIGLIDQNIFFTEAFVSVHSCGKWYADIDILKALQLAPRQYLMLDCGRHVTDSDADTDDDDEGCTTIDNMDELLDPPVETLGIVRAFKNWPARLATYCIVFQKINTKGAFFVDENAQFCYRCLNKTSESVFSKERDAGFPTILID
ncbi:MAG: hypothetical protein Q9227_000181 [Pyrenula ochraceoflavens]